MFYEIYVVDMVNGDCELFISKQYDSEDEACAVAYKLGRDLDGFKLEVVGWSNDTE